ncbi:MAG: helix-turn-helix domain-containing protein [Lachnospiraceae bacterium]|nr:helix-turn-helix domain-containing protein [Lachnospiraceae bacterium]
MLNQYEEIITIDELCDILMIGKNLAYRLLTENKIKAFRIGKKWKIPKSSVIQFIQESTK